MTDVIEQHIRDRAYHLWVEAGRPDGDEEKFWLAAEREMSGKAEPTTPYGQFGGQEEPPAKTNDGIEPLTPYVKD